MQRGQAAQEAALFNRDVQVLVINKASYKEGGILSVRLQGTPVYLRILRITANSVTLALNEARLTLRF